MCRLCDCRRQSVADNDVLKSAVCSALHPEWWNHVVGVGCVWIFEQTRELSVGVLWSPIVKLVFVDCIAATQCSCISTRIVDVFLAYALEKRWEVDAFPLQTECQAKFISRSWVADNFTVVTIDFTVWNAVWTRDVCVFDGKWRSDGIRAECPYVIPLY